ncbi:MAG: hypothetical protein Q8Q29_09650 [Actinomycetota bacterium]|nr:hypothetical protein [Actinomycetota bacterium]
MNGELAQVVALVSHGNVWLHGHADAASRLDRDHPAFEYVRSVSFRRVDRPRNRTRSVAGWFRALGRAGARRTWVLTEVPRSSIHPSDVSAHQLVAFANAGGWAIGVEQADEDELWTAAWKFACGGVWEVEYRGVSLEAPIASLRPATDIPKATAILGAALEGILAFATEHAIHPWAGHFREALDAEDDGLVSALLPPAGYTAEACHLMSVAAKAWVFGGMGSWNDLAFSGSDEDRYRELTSALYAAVLEGIAAAANAFHPSDI